MNTYLVIAAAALSLVMAFALYRKNASIQVEDARMREIAGFIHEGAMAYLKRQYVVMAVFAAIMFVVLLIVLDLPTAICFLVGALFSVLAGFCGMMNGCLETFPFLFLGPSSIILVLSYLSFLCALLVC